MGFGDKLKNKLEAKTGLDLDHDGKIGGGDPKPQGHDDGGHGGKIGAGIMGAGLVHHFHGDSDSGSSSDGHMGAAVLAGAAGLAFFYGMRRHKKRDFVVIIDASASMQSGVFNPIGATRWSETRDALKTIAASACKADPDGLTLYFFNDRVQKFDHVKNDADVNRTFQTFGPAGFTDLTSALHMAFNDHFSKSRKRPTSILIIHDGEPNDPNSTKQAIVQAANQIKSKKELNISFVQVGEDPQATAFLHSLDVGLGTKWDIVDKCTSHDLQGQGFAAAVNQAAM